MASATPSKGKKARASIAKQSVSVEAASELTVDAPSRREFMYYIWGASIALMLGEVTAGLIWFAFPRFKEGEFGGVFSFDPTGLPDQGTPPEWNASGRFHVSNTDDGLLALYGVCTHLGCLPKWVPSNTRFECPCHGSKFENTGSYITGPAPRGLDRFPVTITYSDGETANTPDNGGPIRLDPSRAITQILIDTGARIDGPPQGVDL